MYGVGLLLILLLWYPKTRFSKISFQHHAFFYTQNSYRGADSKIENKHLNTYLTIMKKILSIFLFSITTLFVSCTDPYDDTDIRNDIEDLKGRVSALEKLCKEMNSNISAMQTILNAVQNNDYVTAVNPITENGVIIGYTINFTKSSPVTIYHGKDGKDGENGENGKDGVNGKDGYTPVIGVKQDTDGIYYWTLDGEWLTDENGNRVKAVGTDGKPGVDGKDGITPQLKIENGYWYISYDNGTSWTEVGKATGDKGEQGDKGDKGDTGLIGDSMFEDIDYSNEEYVVFTLSNGTTIKVPTWYAFEQLKTLCNQMNSNINTLQAIVNALQNNDYVTSVTPVIEDGKTIGYTINFTKSNPVTIYHGKDGKDGQNGENGADGKDGANGKDGYTPVIGVKQDTDGIYYWTLDGEWLTDESGNRIKAVGTDGKDGEDGQDGTDGKDGQNGTNGENGKDGADGKDGITPQLKIENGYWYISYDNGKSWTEIGKAIGEKGEDGANGENGKDGDSFFKSVTQDEEYVYLTLADGTVYALPKEAELSISFNHSDLLVMHTNSTREIAYTVKSSSNNVTVEVTSSADIKAKVVTESTNGKSGKVVIKTSGSIDEYSKVIVFVSDGKKVIMKSITFEQSGITISNGANHSIAASGGRVDINFLSNMECEVVIPTLANSWLSVAPHTRAMTAHTATLLVEPNQTLQTRTATVKVLTTDGKLSTDIQITQGTFNEFTATTPQANGWLTNDAITVFAGNTKNRKFVYSGTTGAANGNFIPATTVTGAPTATTAHYALYPYDSNANITATGAISTTFSAEQKYITGSWERKNNIMLAVTDDITDCHLNFQHLTAIVCVKLWGEEQTIKSLSITSNGGEALAGTATIEATPLKITACKVNGSATIKMNGVNEKTVSNSAATATEFYFAVPPITLSQGYTINIEGFYGGKQAIAVAASSFIAGKTYTTTAQLTIPNDGMGTGIGGWGDGSENSGTAD